MNIRLKASFAKGLSLVLSVLLVFPFVVVAQEAPATGSVNQEELDSALAPVALYPDSLLSQILMASTYPLEVVQADRWAKENKDLTGDALASALEAQPWDPSVKSLVNFPQVLDMMNSKLEWTQKLGDVFLAHQKEVMDTVQKLRQKADAEGNLKTTSEQKVIVEKETQTIIIEAANPQVVYVPVYNPTVVYGAWWWPHYPPYYYYPPGYVATSAAFSFAAGVAVGAAWGYAWGNCNWHGGDVNVDVNRNTNINTNIDRSKYQAQIDNRRTGAQGDAGKWQHDASHRQGVSYRDQGTAQKYNRASSTDAVKARESFRGQADQGRQNLASASQPSVSTRQNAGASASTRQNTGMSASTRGGRDSAFSGYGNASQTQRQSSRGTQSRSGGGGGSRGGGGGSSRSGGSRGGGGGGRR